MDSDWMGKSGLFWNLSYTLSKMTISTDRIWLYTSQIWFQCKSIFPSHISEKVHLRSTTLLTRHTLFWPACLHSYVTVSPPSVQPSCLQHTKYTTSIYAYIYYSIQYCKRSLPCPHAHVLDETIIHLSGQSMLRYNVFLICLHPQYKPCIANAVLFKMVWWIWQQHIIYMR